MNETLEKALIYGAITYLVLEIIRCVQVCTKLKCQEKEIRDLEEISSRLKGMRIKKQLEQYDDKIEMFKKQIEEAKEEAQNDDIHSLLKTAKVLLKEEGA